MSTRCVIYCRFSPRRNAEDCESCETQEQLCLAFAEERGWSVTSVHHDEAVSGTTWPRPGLEEAIGDLKKGDVLLVWRRDRLARDPDVAQDVERAVHKAKGTVVATTDIAHGDSPDARLIRRITAAVHAWERETTIERTKASMRARQARGHRMGRWAPYGWRVDSEDRGRLVKDVREQRAVHRILELAADGREPFEIRKVLDEEMPELARGKKWHQTTIEKVLDRK